MKRAISLLALFLVGGLPRSGAAGGLDLRIGGFFPRAQSNLFDDDTELYTVDDADWRGLFGGGEFSLGLSSSLELGFHLDGYSKQIDTTYREFVRPSGREIQQTLKLTIVPLGVSLRVAPGSHHARVVPYAAVGADAVFYKYEEFGDFIDFFDDTRPIYADSFVSNGVAPGIHVAGGLRFRLNDDFSVVAEGRYLWARDDMGDDFHGNKIDLGGWSTTLGVNLRF